MDLKIKIPINDIDNETQSNKSSKKSESQSSPLQKPEQKKKKKPNTNTQIPNPRKKIQITSSLKKKKETQNSKNSLIDNKQVDYFIDDSNIRRENFDCQIDKINKYEYIDCETYLLRFMHREEADTYDYYGIFLEDAKSMKSDIMSLIEKYNKIFNTEFKL